MKKKKGIVRRTAMQIREMRRRGEDRTDHARLQTMTAREVEVSAQGEGEFDWTKAQVDSAAETATHDAPRRRRHRLVQAAGARIQTRMNAVLRRFVEAQKNLQR